MKNIDHHTQMALDMALRYAGLEKEDGRLVYHAYEEGLYHLVVRTFDEEYEFYVDERNGDVPGMCMTPLTNIDMFYILPERSPVPGMNNTKRIA